MRSLSYYYAVERIIRREAKSEMKGNRGALMLFFEPFYGEYLLKITVRNCCSLAISLTSKKRKSYPCLLIV